MIIMIKKKTFPAGLMAASGCGRYIGCGCKSRCTTELYHPKVAYTLS